nr:cobalamin-dependent protein [uncultured Methanoregula sp.]
MDTKGSPVYQPVGLDRDGLAGKALDRYSTAHAVVWRDLSPNRKKEIRAEFMDLIANLQESLAAGSPAFLIDYSLRAEERQAARRFPEGFTESCLKTLAPVLAEELHPDHRDSAARFIRKTLAALKAGPGKSDLFRLAETPLSPAARAFLDALLAGNKNQAEEITDGELKAGRQVAGIYRTIFQPVLVETGRLWQANEAGVDREHYISAAILRLMGRLQDQVPAPTKAGRKNRTVVAACVGEELHEIGIRMVADFFRMDGWDVHYIGANTPAPYIAGAVRDENAGILALSVTLPSRLPELHYLIRSLRADPATAKTRIIVGGYPFLLVPGLWQRIGADAGAPGAEEAVAAARRLMKGTGPAHRAADQ